MHARLLLFIPLLALCGAEDTAPGTPFLSCADKKDPIGLRIKGCTKLPCKLPKGQIASMEVDFEVVTAYALGAVLDYPLKQKNACKSLTNAECPLDKFEEVTYKLELDVDKSYPSISLAVEIALKDRSKRVMTCFKANLQVVDAE